MEPIKNALEGILAGVVPLMGDTCAICHRAFDRLDGGVCFGCSRIKADGESIRARLEDHVREQLLRAGVAPRELAARLSRIPPYIARALPQESVKTMLQGELPARAFAIVGAAGAGKTFCLVAVMAELARQRIRSLAPRIGLEALREWLCWLPWPETVNLFRVMSMRDGGVRDVDAAVKKAIASEVLVLDDIGAERIRGEFQDDAAASKLDLIVDGRHRAMRPTWFTSNEHGPGLRGRYGDRLYRRITQDVDVVTLSD